METNPISAGTILIKAGTPVPSWFRFNCEDYLGWKKLFDVNSYALERLTLAMGWHFLLLAPPIECNALSLTREAAVQHGTKKVMKAAVRSGCNSLEITEILTRDLIVMRQARVIANLRHLKDSPYLKDLDAYFHTHPVGEFEPILLRASKSQPEVKGI